MQNAPLPSHEGHIPLRHKVRPTELLHPEEQRRIICASHRGQVDVTNLAQTLQHGLDCEEWTEEYNQKHNVALKRPFHDKLGVNKIICIFSDNRLTNVYHLPAWEKWKELILPIFEYMKISPHQVARCLFARMPPKVTIPPHHDNGYWVSRTHRMHVPIVTFPEVEFTSGPTEESMQRFAFNEGHIIELNNAAKHAVINNSDQYRIHLIFDYMDVNLPSEPICLSAGQTVLQMRGRVELLKSNDHLGDDDNDNDNDNDDDNSSISCRLKKVSLVPSTSTDATLALKPLMAEVWTLFGQDVCQQCQLALRYYYIEQICAEEFYEQLGTKIGPWHPSLLSKRKGQVAFTTTSFTRPSEINMDTHWFSTFIDRLVNALNLFEPEMSQEVQLVHRRYVRHGWSVPAFIVLGAQKCGTTALYEYLCQHPMVKRGERREPHFFDWNWKAAVHHTLSNEEDDAGERIECQTEKRQMQINATATKEKEVEEQQPQQPQQLIPSSNRKALAKASEKKDNDDDEYDDEKQALLTARSMRKKYYVALQYPLNNLHPPYVIGESTPSYLIYGKPVAERIRMVCPQVRLLVMLRDPVARAYSHYCMTADKTSVVSQMQKRSVVNGKTFVELIQQDIALLQKHSVSPTPALGSSGDDDDLEAFQRYADALPRNHGSHSYVGRGLYDLQLRTWFKIFPSEQILVLCLDDMTSPSQVQIQANKAFEHIGLSHAMIHDTAPKNTREYDPMPDEAKALLTSFYQPYNKALSNLLQRNFGW